MSYRTARTAKKTPTIVPDEAFKHLLDVFDALQEIIKLTTYDLGKRRENKSDAGTAGLSRDMISRSSMKLISFILQSVLMSPKDPLLMLASSRDLKAARTQFERMSLWWSYEWQKQVSGSSKQAIGNITEFANDFGVRPPSRSKILSAVSEFSFGSDGKTQRRRSSRPKKNSSTKCR